MKSDTQPPFPAAEFTRPYEALTDTPWTADPANPITLDIGVIHQGELVWLHPYLLASTPVWQLARLANQSLVYVRHNDFIPMVKS